MLTDVSAESGLEAGREAGGSLLAVEKAGRLADPCARLPSHHSPPLAAMSTPTRITHTVLIFSTFLGFGLCRGIYGPTLMELRAITNVSLTQISILFTCLGVGGIAGSLIFGRLFDMVRPLTLFVVALVGVAIVTSLIPWLHILSVMMGACALQSFLYSGLAIGCTVTLFRLWRACSRQIFLSMHLVYTIGGFIAPLLSEPFLARHPHEGSFDDINFNTSVHPLLSSNFSITYHPALNSTTHIRHEPGTKSASLTEKPLVGQGMMPQNMSTNLSFSDDGGHNKGVYSINSRSSSDIETIHPADWQPSDMGLFRPRSRIVFTYLIIGIYLLIVGVGMFCLLLYMRNQNTGTYWREERPNNARPCHISTFRLLATILFMLYNFNFGGQETVYSGILFTFAVQHVGFSPTSASLLVSILYTAHAAGRFLVIIVSHWVPNALYVLLCSMMGCAISCAILTHYTTTNIPALWSATVVAGLSVSTMYSMGLLWAKDFLPITATFTSLYTIAYTSGMMLWPPLTSYFMKTRGSAWFAYMNVIMLINYAVAISLLFILYRCRHRFKDSYIAGDENIGEGMVQRVDDDLIANSMLSLHAL